MQHVWGGSSKTGGEERAASVQTDGSEHEQHRDSQGNRAPKIEPGVEHGRKCDEKPPHLKKGKITIIITWFFSAVDKNI